MKKVLFLGALISVIGTTSLANNQIFNNLNSIEQQIQMLEQREQERFASEENQAEIANASYNKYMGMIEETAQKIQFLRETSKTSFFPTEHKQLLEKYIIVDKRLKDKANVEMSKIQKFEELKSNFGY